MRGWSLSREEASKGRAAVGDGDGAGAGEKFVGGIDAEGGMNGGMKIGDRDRVFDRLFGEVVGGSVGTLVFEPAAGEDEGEGRSLVTAAAVAIEFGRASELGGNHDEGFVEEVFPSEVVYEGGDSVVEVTDEPVLF